MQPWGWLRVTSRHPLHRFYATRSHSIYTNLVSQARTSIHFPSFSRCGLWTASQPYEQASIHSPPSRRHAVKQLLYAYGRSPLEIFLVRHACLRSVFLFELKSSFKHSFSRYSRYFGRLGIRSEQSQRRAARDQHT